MNRSIAHAAPFVALVIACAVAPFALAAKGGGGKPAGGGSSSFSVVVMDGATAPAHHGRITFDVSTTETKVPEVGLRCYQDSNWVFDAYVGYFPEYLFDPWFTLDSNYWEDGVAATCNARLFYYDRRGREVVLKTMSFPVAA
jgi:hypothetical protein